MKSRTLRDGAPWLQYGLDAIGLGRQPQQRRLSARAVSENQIAARTQQGDHRVAASILTAAYYLVRDLVPYRELSSLYLLRLDHERAAARLTQRLRNLGYEVEIKKPQLNSRNEVSW